LPSCPECAGELRAPIAVMHRAYVREERYFCAECLKLHKAVASRDFDAEDAGAEEPWGPLLWDLGALPRDHPFAEAA
jgi:hypothetical protein